VQVDVEVKGRAETLDQRGRIKALMGELKAAIGGLREERLAAKAAGRQPAYCPEGKGPLERKELMAALHAVPEGERANVLLENALRPALVKKNPCEEVSQDAVAR
jgi:hypothetical protein